MAKIIIAGNSCTVESSLTTEQIEKIAKFRPAALQLMDADKKKVEFVIKTGAVGSVAPLGIAFDGTTHDGKKLACLTKMLPASVTDVKSWVMDNIGSAILKLNKLEASLSDVLNDIDAEVDAVENTIAVVSGAEDAE